MRRFLHAPRWVAMIGVCLAILSGVALNNRVGIRSIARENQKLTQTVEKQALINCQEVESLKQRVRDKATEDHNNVERNAALLHIELTPELRAQVDADYNATLKRYAADPCPRPTS